MTTLNHGYWTTFAFFCVLLSATAAPAGEPALSVTVSQGKTVAADTGFAQGLNDDSPGLIFRGAVGGTYAFGASVRGVGGSDALYFVACDGSRCPHGFDPASPPAGVRAKLAKGNSADGTLGPLKEGQTYAVQAIVMRGAKKVASSRRLVVYARRDALLSETLQVSGAGGVARTGEQLKLGRTYRLTFEGTYSMWAAGCADSSHAHGLDAFFCYERMGSCSTPPKPMGVVTLGSSDWIKPITEVAAASGKTLKFNPAHRYTFYVKGTGDSLRISVNDKDPRDNCGSLKVTIEEEL